jgi:hypothetical protein
MQNNMHNIFSENIPWALGIVVVLFGIVAAHRLFLYRQKKNKMVKASEKFRNEILTELEGLYPTTHYWDKNVYPRLAQSITKIESAAIKFRPYAVRKSEFDSAIKKYCEYCKSLTWEKVTGWDMYPSMRTPGEIGPKEKFKQIVEIILSFTKDQ